MALTIFNPCSSLASVATDDRNQYHCLNIGLQEQNYTITFGIRLMRKHVLRKQIALHNPLQVFMWRYFLIEFYLAWENSRHLETVPLVAPNDVWETSAEILYWWRVTTQIWVVLLIGRAAWEICFNQSEARHQYRISALVSQTSLGGENMQ